MLASHAAWRLPWYRARYRAQLKLPSDAVIKLSRLFRHSFSAHAALPYVETTGSKSKQVCSFKKFSCNAWDRDWPLGMLYEWNAMIMSKVASFIISQKLYLFSLFFFCALEHDYSSQHTSQQPTLPCLGVIFCEKRQSRLILSGSFRLMRASKIRRNSCSQICATHGWTYVTTCFLIYTCTRWWLSRIL